jgi:hypothetical protein
MTVIESADYEQARQRFMKDPIVMAMAKGLKGVPVTEIAHEGSKTPKFEFMQAANREYQSRGGKDAAHIGAIAEALIRLLEADK